ncbi:Putative Ig [uncultured Caudovirales phage]|uniref:Ig n=1 Tax=uncultured Caudovirales phage TaxID=2100421 RepID=A0A6J5T0U3_9CAUD|nr:Putative Ig [uncultured Caudovirales phage]
MTIKVSDFASSSLSGNVVLTAKTAIFTTTILADGFPEGAAKIIAKLRQDSETGNVLAASDTILINDNSQAGTGVAITVLPFTLVGPIRLVAYSRQLTGAGGTAPYQFSYTGSLPTGLDLLPNGILTGIPLEVGVFNFTVTATDVNTDFGSTVYQLAVTGPGIYLFPPTLNAGYTNLLYNTSVAATGGLPPYEFTISQGALPTGVVLTLSGNFEGKPQDAGPVAIVVTATDSNGNTGSKSYIININRISVVVSPPTLPPAFKKLPYSQAITGTGGTLPYSWSVISDDTFPTGILLDPATGVVSGTTVVVGSKSVTVKITDKDGNYGTANYTFLSNEVSIYITPNTATLASIQINSTYNQVLTATGGVYLPNTTPSYTWIVFSGSLPPGITFNGVSGTLAGRPTEIGNYSFSIQATDGYQNSGTRSYLFNVLPVTVTVSPADLGLITIGEPYTQVFSATGGEAPYTYSVYSGSLPEGITLNPNGTLTGTTYITLERNVTIKITDINGNFVLKQIKVSVASDHWIISLKNVNSVSLESYSAAESSNNPSSINTINENEYATRVVVSSRYSIGNETLYWNIAQAPGISAHPVGDDFGIITASTVTKSIYDFDTSFATEFSFNAGQITLAKWIATNLYQSNSTFNTDTGTKYGLFRKPDAAGLASWVRGSTVNNWGVGNVLLVNQFFKGVSTELDYSRSLTSNKTLLSDANQSGSNFYDRPDSVGGTIITFDPYTYTNGYSQEFNVVGADLTLAQWIGANLYTSNDQFTTNLTPAVRYGLFRNPDLLGLNGWVNRAKVMSWGVNDANLINEFFANASISALDGPRSLTNKKDFIAGHSPGDVFYDRPNKTGMLALSAVADSITEGSEQFIVEIRQNSLTGPVVAVTDSITIADNSTASSTVYNNDAIGFRNFIYRVREGDTLNFEVLAPGNVPISALTTNLTQITVSTPSTATPPDFVVGTKTVPMVGRVGLASLTVVADMLTEGEEYVTIAVVYNGTQQSSLEGPVLIADTSKVTYEFTNTPAGVNEGDVANFSIRTTGVSDGTRLYWRINHISTQPADFSNAATKFEVLYAFANNPLAPLKPSSEAVIDYWMTNGLSTFNYSILTIRSGDPALAQQIDAARITDSTGTGGQAILATRAAVLKAYNEYYQAQMFPGENDIRYWMTNGLGINNNTFIIAIQNANSANPALQLGILQERADLIGINTRWEVIYAFAGCPYAPITPTELEIADWRCRGLAGFQQNMVSRYTGTRASTILAQRDADKLISGGGAAQYVVSSRTQVLAAYQDDPDANPYPTEVEIRYWMEHGLGVNNVTFSSAVQTDKIQSPTTYAQNSAIRTQLTSNKSRACKGSILVQSDTCTFGLKARADMLAETEQKFTISLSTTENGEPVATTSIITIADTSVEIYSTVPVDYTGIQYSYSNAVTGYTWYTVGYGYPMLVDSISYNISGLGSLGTSPGGSFVVSGGIGAVTPSLNGTSPNFTINNPTSNNLTYQIVAEYFVRSNLTIVYSIYREVSPGNDILIQEDTASFNRVTGLDPDEFPYSRYTYWPLTQTGYVTIPGGTTYTFKTKMTASSYNSIPVGSGLISGTAGNYTVYCDPSGLRRITVNLVTSANPGYGLPFYWIEGHSDQNYIPPSVYYVYFNTIGQTTVAINEGASFNVILTGLYLANATYTWTLYRTAGGGAVAGTDFIAVTGTVAVTSNYGSFGVTSKSDALTEGTATYYVTISLAGSIIITSDTIAVTVYDTSLTPPPPPPPYYPPPPPPSPPAQSWWSSWTSGSWGDWRW